MRLLLSIFLIICTWGTICAAQNILREHKPGEPCFIVQEQHLTPEVSIHVAIRAAPAYEGALLGTGVSALVQRLKVATSGDAVRDLLQRSGSRLSFQSHHGYSSYHLSTTAEHASEAIEALAKILAHSTYTEDEFRFEQQRLLVEQHNAEKDVSTHIEHILRGAFYRSDVWRLPVNGLAQELQALSFQQLKDYDALRYRRGHLTLVVTGNIATENILKQARASFKQLRAGFIAEEIPHENVPQLSSRIIKTAADVRAQEIVIAWRTTMTAHNDQAILDIIAEYLQAAQSPLRQALQGSQLVEDLEVSNRRMPFVPGYLQIRYRLRGDNRSTTMHKLKEVLRSLQKDGIPSDELHAINLRLQRKASQLKNNARLSALDMLHWEMSVAAPAYGAELRHQYGQVQSEHIQQAARYYLSAERICMLSVQPLSTQLVEHAGTHKGANDAENVDIVVQRAITSVPPRTQQLNNGIHIIERQLPMDLVYITASLGGGSARDDERLRGVNELLSRVMTLQTKTRNATQMQKILSKHGMTLEAHNGEHALQLSVTCFPKDTMLAIGILNDCLVRPQFQESDIQVARQHILEEMTLEQGDVSWQSLLNTSMRAMIFKGHYAGRSLFGSRKSLNDIDSKILREHLRAQVYGANIVLSIYGSYDRAKIKKFLHLHLTNKLFFPVGPRQQARGTQWTGTEAQSTAIKGEVHAFAYAWPAPAIDDPLTEQIAMDVLVAMLTGVNGNGGRLAAARRNSKNDPFVKLEQHRERYHSRGIWSLQAQVHADSMMRARDLMEHIVAVCVKDLGDEQKKTELDAEIKSAQSLCQTIHALNDTDQEQATRVHARSLLQYGNLDPVLLYNKKLQAVRREDIVAVAQKFMTTKPFIVQMAPDKIHLERIDKMLKEAPPKAEKTPQTLPTPKTTDKKTGSVKND